MGRISSKTRTARIRSRPERDCRFYPKQKPWAGSVRTECGAHFIFVAARPWNEEIYVPPDDSGLQEAHFRREFWKPRRHFSSVRNEMSLVAALSALSTLGPVDGVVKPIGLDSKSRSAP